MGRKMGSASKPQDAAARRKTPHSLPPQDAAKRPFLRNSYVLWHVSYVNVRMKAY